MTPSACVAPGPGTDRGFGHLRPAVRDAISELDAACLVEHRAPRDAAWLTVRAELARAELAVGKTEQVSDRGAGGATGSNAEAGGTVPARLPIGA